MTASGLFWELRRCLERETAAFELSQLFDRRLGKNARIAFPQAEVAPGTEAALREECARLKAGYPLQYILGEWDFYGLTLKVGEGVLIPRADTEAAVETALALLASEKTPVIADLCSGSGAIALAIAQNLPRCEVFAVELFDRAFSYLVENIAALDKEGRVRPVKADVLGDIAAVLPCGLDMVISNPPYVTADEMEQLPAEVQHEPKTALYGGGDGLTFYRSIAKSAQTLLKAGGRLVFEVGWRQGKDVAEIMRENGFCELSSAKDAAGIDRCIYGRKPL